MCACGVCVCVCVCVWCVCVCMWMCACITVPALSSMGACCVAMATIMYDYLTEGNPPCAVSSSPYLCYQNELFH